MESLPSPSPQVTTPVTFSDIGGAKRAKELIYLMASWSVTNSQKITEWGLTAPSGALLYGPPGTGKTLLAKAAAHSCNCRFFSITIPDLLRCEVGESEKRLVVIFEEARANAPSLVFIDEIQALFGRRTGRREDSNRLVVQLITQLDLSSRHGNVFSLAATNALEAVDQALLQPGRFEEVVEIGMPDEKERAEILEVALRNMQHDPVDVQQFARLTHGYTASDIVGVCQKAGLAALMDSARLNPQYLQKEITAESFKRFATGDNEHRK